MKILWFSWKDSFHPEAGGAEAVTHQMLSRAAADGHEVVLISSRFPDSEAQASYEGYQIQRVGSRWTVYLAAWRLYKKQFQGWADLIVDECNTIPFFTRFYTPTPRVMVFYQLCREIWFYQMAKPLSWVGYLIEPLYLWLLRKEKVITISQSSVEDLCKFGFEAKNIDIITLGIMIPSVTDPHQTKKAEDPTLISLGAIRPMKRTDEIVTAFELAKTEVPSLKLVVAGLPIGDYGEAVSKQIERSPYREDIEFLGRISAEEKLRLMQKAHWAVVTSLKEGWCLVVTEANSQGTPAIGYDVDGLRDSIKNGETGLLTEQNNPQSLSDTIIQAMNQEDQYSEFVQKGWDDSQTITYERGYEQFKEMIRRFTGVHL